MSTKLRGDIAEQAAILKGLKLGWNVLTPIGDRLSYDLVFEFNGKFARIQTKHAWYSQPELTYKCDSRRRATNQNVANVKKYVDSDFDFALIYLTAIDVWYVMPSSVFNSFAGPLTFLSEDRQTRLPKSFIYKEAWNLIENWFVSE